MFKCRGVTCGYFVLLSLTRTSDRYLGGHDHRCRVKQKGEERETFLFCPRFVNNFYFFLFSFLFLGESRGFVVPLRIFLSRRIAGRRRHLRYLVVLRCNASLSPRTLPWSCSRRRQVPQQLGGQVALDSGCGRSTQS